MFSVGGRCLGNTLNLLLYLTNYGVYAFIMCSVSLELKSEWIDYCCWTGSREPFEPIDMDWFASVDISSTKHHIKRQQERDQAKALNRIRSLKGLHPLFGTPLMARCLTNKNRVIIAAHDVCIIAANTSKQTVKVITTLPMKPRGPLSTFNEFVKFHCPQAMPRLRRPGLNKGVKQSRKLFLKTKDDDVELCSKVWPVVPSKLQIVTPNRSPKQLPKSKRKRNQRRQPLTYLSVIT